ncbi:blast:Carboxypeptidase N subunit 2 [Drosophila guanche]|uniref:Blast:Carboxypeptidase N subunit 2 n=2 Tax=Drosophila guanche TaxID=7266 RepID=A0A3B0K268_DROGU|nr:blast:Carboxypeptidase N subunit 2 [Drosophila guanche]
MLSLRKLEDLLTILLFVASNCESQMLIKEMEAVKSRRIQLKEVAVERLDCQESLCVGLEYPSASEVAFFGENITNQLNDYKALVIHSSRLTNLPRNVFHSLPQLAEFHVLESEVQHIERECFRGGEQNLKILNLGGNAIKKIAGNTFELSTELENLNLSDNILEELPRGVFLALKKLQQLNLSNNHLKIVSPDVFSPLKELQSVNLDRNLLNELPRGLFKDLKLLSVRNNLLERISMHMFASMEYLIISDNPQLTQLHLKGDIKELQATNCGLTSVILDGRIISLYLENNFHLGDVRITQPQTLEQLYLTNANLSSLGFLSKATRLMDLDLPAIETLKDVPYKWKSKQLKRLSLTYPTDIISELKDLNFLEINQEKLQEIYIKHVDYDLLVNEDKFKCEHLRELLRGVQVPKDVTFWEEDSTLNCGDN